MGEEVIVAQDLTRRFGDFTAVDHVSFSVKAGEVVGYLGPNGSGKTTTIRMLLGLLLPSEGKASVLGYDIVSQSEQVRARVGYMSQKFALYHDLTTRENLAFYAGVYGVRENTRLKDVMELAGLEEVAEARVSTLSTGFKQRLALGTAIVHSPQLLFLDEPTSGVDPTARRAFWELIYELVGQGVTAFVTTHYMDEAEYCGRVGIMRAGRLLAMDTPSELKVRALPGEAWDIFIVDRPARGLARLTTEQGRIPPEEVQTGIGISLLTALEILQAHPDVLRAGLVSDHLRAITRLGIGGSALKSILRDAGFESISVEQTEPTLEDVFLSLAARGVDWEINELESTIL